MKRLLALSILVFMVGFIGNAYSPDEQKFKVFVFVSTPEEDNTEKLTIDKHIKRELRAIGDVDLVDYDDDWEFLFLLSAKVFKLSNGLLKINEHQSPIQRPLLRRLP